MAHAHALSSAGLDATGRGSSAGWYITFNGQHGNGLSARRADSFAEFEACLARTAKTASQLESSTEPVQDAEPWVLLHPSVVDRYVLDTVIHHLSGSVIAHGEGRFSKEEFANGSQVFGPSFCLKVDPLQPLRSGSYRFTIEGVPACAGAFVADGRLVQPLLDMKYARRLGLEPGPLIYDSDCLEFNCGETMNLADARHHTGRGVEVLSVLGIHTQDISSGDFSLSAPQALVYANGRVTGKQKGTLSGNLFELLQDPGDQNRDVSWREHTGLAVALSI